MRSIVGIEELKCRLSLLIGKPVWAIPAGGCAGSTILVYIGEKIPRHQKCENPALSEEARSYKAELRLMVWCAWRVETEGTSLICGSGDLDEEVMLGGLAKLIGQGVTEVSLTPFLDLLVTFTEGARLRLFCERRTDDLDTEACYALFVREEEVCSVGNGVIVLERKDSGKLENREEGGQPLR
jgi:hypothetical protein